MRTIRRPSEMCYAKDLSQEVPVWYPAPLQGLLLMAFFPGQHTLLECLRATWLAQVLAAPYWMLPQMKKVKDFKLSEYGSDPVNTT